MRRLWYMNSAYLTYTYTYSYTYTRRLMVQWQYPDTMVQSPGARVQSANLKGRSKN